MQREFRINVPISKIDEEQRMVWGIATTESIDSQGDIVDYEASKTAFGKWLGNIREMHQPIAVGKNLETQYDDVTKQVMIGAKISESTDGENAWIKVKEKILQGFSIGGAVNRVAKEVVKTDKGEKNVTRIVDYDLAEVSLVDNPANPDAMFVMVKSADGGLQRTEHMATPAEIKKEFRVPYWMTQFMPPIEKAQALYDKGMSKESLTKAGVAAVDSDPRDASGNTVAEVSTQKPAVKGGTKVTKPVVGRDGKSTTTKAKDVEVKKGLYSASFLLELACNLSWYIQDEQYEGENVDDLNAALATIKAAIIDELTEPDALEGAVELATKLSNLKKGNAMSKKKELKKDDSAATEEEVTTETEVAENADTATEEATAAEGEEQTENAADESTEDTGAEADKADETAEGEAEDESSDEDAEEDGSEKAITLGDLRKFSDGLIAKLGDKGEPSFQKAMGEFTDKVEKSLTALEGRIKTLENSPAASKAKASYVVDKGDEGKEGSEDVAELVKRRDELAANPSLGTPQERMELSDKLRKAQRDGHKI